jgi:hypothetical protein
MWNWYIERMNVNEIATALDAEIARLQQARDAIAGIFGDTKLRGKPPASRSIKAKKRTLSAAGREKIAAAQRKRWAKQKQIVVTKLPPKQAPTKRPRKHASVKAKTALTGKVPSGPVAVPASTKRLSRQAIPA